MRRMNIKYVVGFANKIFLHEDNIIIYIRMIIAEDVP